MELSSILFLVLVFVAFILTIFFVVKDFAALGVLHTILFVLLFICVVTFTITTAKVHQFRVTDIQRYAKAKAANVNLTDQLEQIKFGYLTTPTADISNLLPLLSELGRLNLDRGRVWRGVAPQDFSNGIASVSLPPATASVAPSALGADPAPAAANVTPDNLTPEMIVYVFGEGVDQNNRVVPLFYLGEFFVAESQGGTAKLRPTINLTASQTQALQSAQFPRWSIYELMPLDDHRAFAEPNSERTEDEIFGRMDPAVISSLLNIPVELLEKATSEMTPEEAINAAILRSYVLDGQRAPDGTPPEAIWSRIKFLQEHSITVDSTENRNALEGGYFDLSGRTVDARLKRATGEDDPSKSTVEFRRDDEVVFPSETADDLIGEGKAQLLAEIYVRPLNDYAYLFKQTQLRINRAIQEIELTQREITRTQETEKKGQDQIVAKQAERQKLNADLTQLEKELAVVRSELQGLDGQVGEMKSELSNLFQRSQELYRRLIQTQQAMAAGIN